MDETVDLHELALATSGAVGADLANIINEGALAAVRDGRSLVSQQDLIGAVEVVFAGKEKKDRLLSKEEKQIVAYHEVGHALLAAIQKHTEPIQRITIVPRKWDLWVMYGRFRKKKNIWNPRKSWKQSL